MDKSGPLRLKVAIVFAHWWGVGGGLHHVLATIVNVLSERNMEVQVLNWGIPSFPTLRRLHALRQEPTRTYGNRFSVYVPYLLREPILEGWEILRMIWLSKRVDFVIFVGPTFFHPARFVPYSKNKVIVYQLGPKWKRMPEIMASSQSFPKKMLRVLYEKSWPTFTGPSKKHFYLAHNTWAKALVERDYALKVHRVLAHPVAGIGSVSEIRKQNSVIDFGRFHPDKRHELSVEIIGRVASKVPDAKLYIVGLANQPEHARIVLSNLADLVRRKSLEKNVFVMKDLPFIKIIELMKSCKVILSNQTEPEAFLLTLLEGMACGCVPVIPAVRRGAWEDILAFGEYGFGFKTIEEASETIRNILSLPEEQYQELSAKAARRVMDFSEDKFGDSLVSIIKEVLAR